MGTFHNQKIMNGCALSIFFNQLETEIKILGKGFTSEIIKKRSGIKFNSVLKVP